MIDGWGPFDKVLVASTLILIGCCICWIGTALSEARQKLNEEDHAELLRRRQLAFRKQPLGADSEPAMIRGAREVS